MVSSFEITVSRIKTIVRWLVYVSTFNLCVYNSSIKSRYINRLYEIETPTNTVAGAHES